MNNTRLELDKWQQTWENALKNGFNTGNKTAEEKSAEEEKPVEIVDGSLIQEEVKTNPKDVAKALVNSPNVIKPSTIGVDQDMTDPVSMGATYDVGDIEKLNDLKLKLHGLLDKLNTLHGFGESTTKLEAKIAEVQKQIDEISNGLSKVSVPSAQSD